MVHSVFKLFIGNLSLLKIDRKTYIFYKMIHSNDLWFDNIEKLMKN
jgi:hypothetical protein